MGEKVCVAAWPFDSSTRRAEGLEASKSVFDAETWRHREL